MKSRYDLVIFDLDGTLLDTARGLVATVTHTIDVMGFAPQSPEVLSTFIGPPIQDSFARVYGLSGPILQEIAGVFRDRYSTVDLLGADPYEGIFELFDALKRGGVKSAVATYKREDYALTLLRHFGFDRYAEVMHGGDHENKLKKKDIIDLCIKECGVTDRSRVVMVGDTLHDAVGAKEMGIDFIGVTYGFGFKCAADLGDHAAVGMASTPLEILDLIQ